MTVVVIQGPYRPQSEAGVMKSSIFIIYLTKFVCLLIIEFTVWAHLATIQILNYARIIIWIIPG